MSRTVEQIKQNMQSLRFNPTQLVRLGIDMLEEASDGTLQFVDVTNPVVATISTCATMVASYIDQAYVLTRKQYPYSAQTFEDLYPHMSDKDYNNIYAKPSHAEFMFVFDLQELERNMMPVGMGDNHLIVIPRNTKVVLGEIVFSLQYPIEIRRFNSGGYRVNYNVTDAGPIRKIKNNSINSELISPEPGVNVLTFNVVLDQFDIVSKILHTNLSSVNTITIPFADEYCTARVWLKNAAGVWVEIATTHTDVIYPITKPTACLQVIGKSLFVKIPQIYINSGIIDGAVRIDVYHTRAELSMNLSNYSGDNYYIEWLAIDPSEKSVYTAPIESVRHVQVYSRDIVRGGMAPMSFNQLYNRVISNAIGNPDLPLTQLQIESGYERHGFKLSRVLDNLSNRIYLAIRSMPAPTSKSLLTACASGVETFNDTISALSSISTVVINEEYTTILPTTLYKREGGRLLVVRQEEVNTVNAASGDELPSIVAKNKYVFSPFHHVLDISNNEFSSRVYWLDDPQINWRSFEADNESTRLSVYTAFSVIEKAENGYRITVTTKSSVSYKNVQNNDLYAQLSFTSPVDGELYVINGVMLGVTDTDERIFRFDLVTSYLINGEHMIEIINSFNKTTGLVENAFIDLNQQFNIVYATSSIMPHGWSRSMIDNYIGFVDIPDSTKAITQETLSVFIGQNLNYLWSRARSVVSEEFYERYATNVYETYTSDVYDIDKKTNSIFSFDDDGNIVYNIKYKAGDTVINADGSKKIKYSMGDIKIDSFGKKIISDPRKIRRQFDIIILDGVYKFANTQSAKDYVAELSKQVVMWVNEDMPELDKTLLELTKIFFYPRKTIGLVDVMYDNGKIATIESAQSFNVTLYVNPSLFENEDLRESVRQTTIQTIDRSLSNGTVAVSDIINAIRTNLPDNVLGIDLSGFGEAGDLRIVSMVDSAHSLSINKRLSYRSDGSLTVAEDINVGFIRHDLLSSEKYKKV